MQDKGIGRDAYRRSLEQNTGNPVHGRKSKPMSAAKREELARLYDIEVSKKATSLLDQSPNPQ